MALKSHPTVRVRMGIHSGPVNEIVDVNKRSNIAGAGINIAQRVMDCGDAGHILMSKRVANNLAQYRHLEPLLHELGECEVKHGTVVSVSNLHAENVGNPAVPEKFRAAKEKQQTSVAVPSPARSKSLLITLTILICSMIGLAIVAVIFVPAARNFFPRQRPAVPDSVFFGSPSATASAIPEIIPRLKEILAKPDPAMGYINGELRFWLGWAQDVAGDHAAARETWRQARSELESLLKEQPEIYALICDLALTNMGLGDKAAALGLSERAITAVPIEKDAFIGPNPIEIFARVAAQMGEPARAIAALQKLLSIPYNGPLADGVPLTPALLRLDPMFDPLRNDPQFQKLVASPATKTEDK